MGNFQPMPSSPRQPNRLTPDSALRDLSRRGSGDQMGRQGVNLGLAMCVTCKRLARPSVQWLQPQAMLLLSWGQTGSGQRRNFLPRGLGSWGYQRPSIHWGRRVQWQAWWHLLGVLQSADSHHTPLTTHNLLEGKETGNWAKLQRGMDSFTS